MEKNMGRSVSYADNSEHIAYSYLECDRYYCGECSDTFNEYGTRDAKPGDYGYDAGQPDDEQVSVNCCPHCQAHEDECSEQDPSDNWSYYCEDLQREMIQAFPSLSECDEWVGREDHALLENNHCYIGVSEYCGLVSIWVQPKEPDWRDTSTGLRDRWIAQIGPKFHKVSNTCFGTALRKLGSFSNGEGVYQRIAA